VLLIASAVLLGFVHGLGADHLMAITALTIGGEDSAAARRARALRVAVRFAVGHALVLAVGATAVVLAGAALPPSMERGGELVGGMLLIVFGVVGLSAAFFGHLYVHAHAPAADPGAWHMHLGAPRAHAMGHSLLPGVIGGVFAVSSLRALSVLAPFGGSVAGAAVAQIVLLIALFSVGILISMSLFGVALARTLSSVFVARLGRTAAILMSSASLLLGVYWIVSAL
jgi:nickel/cobalt exporter